MWTDFDENLTGLCSDIWLYNIVNIINISFIESYKLCKFENRVCFVFFSSSTECTPLVATLTLQNTIQSKDLIVPGCFRCVSIRLGHLQAFPDFWAYPLAKHCATLFESKSSTPCKMICVKICHLQRMLSHKCKCEWEREGVPRGQKLGKWKGRERERRQAGLKFAPFIWRARHDTFCTSSSHNRVICVMGYHL